jgi:hypothetical protein
MTLPAVGGKDQTPYRFHSLNHGLFACISSCFRLAAQRSDNWSALVSGTEYSSSSHSISAIDFSRFMLSIPSIYRLRVPRAEKADISIPARQHGALRREQGYTAAMLVEESRILKWIRN